MATAPKTQYVESVAEGYAAAYDKLPLAELEYEMVSKAIGDCTGKTVLDLGGGNGQYARKAVELGAELVDVIDISSAMLQLGRKMEEERGHHSKIRWFEGDATKALHNLPLLPDGYDVVMRNWVFDHATNEDELESMWRNTSAQCKPGGRLVNVRGTGPYDAGYAVNGKYGISLSDVTPIPGGTRYQVHCHLDPPIEFEGTSLKTTSSLSNEINHRYGFGDLDILKPENTETVRANEGFWEEFVRTPYLAILTARKL